MGSLSPHGFAGKIGNPLVSRSQNCIWFSASFCIIWICKYLSICIMSICKYCIRFWGHCIPSGCLQQWLDHDYSILIHLWPLPWSFTEGGWCCQNLWPWLLGNKEYHDARCGMIAVCIHLPQKIEIGPSQFQSITKFLLVVFVPFCCLPDCPAIGRPLLRLMVFCYASPTLVHSASPSWREGWRQTRGRYMGKFDS